MRRLFLGLAALAFVTAAATSSLAQGLTVPVDQSVAVALPPGAMNVMIGNPAIADINVLDPRNAVVLGKAFGVTNLLIMDGGGHVLMDRQVVVSGGDVGHITAIRGGPTGPHVDSYACASRCERAVTVASTASPSAVTAEAPKSNP